MKTAIRFGMIFAVLAALSGASRAEERTFDEAVDPARFRKGNVSWDTQELVASGMRALHEEQVRILNQLDRIESRLERLERELGDERE